MNKYRRTALLNISEQLEDLKFSLEAILSDEEVYRDNIPENLQGSSKYEAAENACSSLEDAVCSLQFAIWKKY